ncbi:uncharacterized protein LOC143803743 [Ranitomeya variabilis]|uniref:uncharacterized protein LOC143803743 n=1 Tax=Ranitomeya variabilis TaxID=490064 RepID=UPI004055CF6F
MFQACFTPNGAVLDRRYGTGSLLLFAVWSSSSTFRSPAPFFTFRSPAPFFFLQSGPLLLSAVRPPSSFRSLVLLLSAIWFSFFPQSGSLLLFPQSGSFLLPSAVWFSSSFRSLVLFFFPQSGSLLLSAVWFSSSFRSLVLFFYFQQSGSLLLLSAVRPPFSTFRSPAPFFFPQSGSPSSFRSLVLFFSSRSLVLLFFFLQSRPLLLSAVWFSNSLSAVWFSSSSLPCLVGPLLLLCPVWLALPHSGQPSSSFRSLALFFFPQSGSLLLFTQSGPILLLSAVRPSSSTFRSLALFFVFFPQSHTARTFNRVQAPEVTVPHTACCDLTTRSDLSGLDLAGYAARDGRKKWT